MSLYIDFIPRMVLPDGVIAGPAGNGRLGAVTRDDVADATVTLLLDDERADGQSHDLTGPRAFTLAEAARELSALAGRPIAYRDETLEEARASRADYGAPEWQLQAWISTYTAIAAGDLDVVTDAVERLAGHPPTSLADYVRAHPESLDHVRR